MYFGIGFNHEVDHFFIFYLIIWGLVQASMSMGYLVSSLFEDFAIANMISPVLMMPFMLFSGFYANLSSLLVWIEWFQWCSPLKYALEAILMNEYREVDEGFDIIDALGFHFGLWPCIIVLLAMGLLCRILAIIALK
jgi:ABC-type multidrug transport system permease subunit